VPLVKEGEKPLETLGALGLKRNQPLNVPAFGNWNDPEAAPVASVVAVAFIEKHWSGLNTG